MLKANTYVAERSWYIVALDPITFVDYVPRLEAHLDAQDWINSIGGSASVADIQQAVDVVDSAAAPQ